VSSIVDSIAGVMQPWADFYGHHKSVSNVVTWLHLSALLVGGGAAVTADRRVLALGNADIDDLRRGLADLARTHTTVIAALTLSVLTGLTMLVSDVKTFLVSPVYWTKMSLVFLLLLNGYILTRTERRLGGDPSPTNRLWQRLSLGALASITLWVSITLAGVVLVNS
jgi:hypothetical protein